MSEIPFYPDEHEPPQRGIETTADLQALADVRTLDEWADANRPEGSEAPSPFKVRDANGRVAYRVALPLCGFFDGPTPDAARHEAAEWVRGQARGTPCGDCGARVGQSHKPGCKGRPRA